VSRVETVFDNRGTVEVVSGMLSIDNVFLQMAGRTRLAGGNLQARGGFNMRGGVLDGSGAIGGNVSNGGETSPGVSPGVLAMLNDYTQVDDGILRVDIDGTGAGEFDQLTVDGRVELAGTLQVVARFAPQIDAAFVVLENGGTDAIVGMFDGLPEGATVEANGPRFEISYVGGTGNDVTLTYVGGIPATLTPSATPTEMPTTAPTPTVTAARACVGDCDITSNVTVDEIVRCVSIALGTQSMQDCAACDRDRSATVTVDEIITAVNNALNGCPSTS
jgi:hypothetical protein